MARKRLGLFSSRWEEAGLISKTAKKLLYLVQNSLCKGTTIQDVVMNITIKNHFIMRLSSYRSVKGFKGTYPSFLLKFKETNNLKFTDLPVVMSLL